MAGSTRQFDLDNRIRHPGRSCPRQRRWRRSVAARLLPAFVWLLVTTVVLAQDPTREYKIKAAYLYNFGRYIEWPDSAFRESASTFVIGVMQSDPIGADLDSIAAAKRIAGRNITVRRFSTAEEVTRCHILFLPRTAGDEVVKSIVSRFAGQHTLFVGEADSFLENGGVIGFVIQQNNVRVMIALKAAERENLKISSKLLQVAQVVN
jgi:hypothetical protein